MAYDPDLADRIRSIVHDDPQIAAVLAERKMFGGIAFLVAGNMAVAANSSGGLMIRLDPAAADDLVDGVHIRPMEMRGRPMAGWLQLDPEVLASDEDLDRYIRLGVAYARGLPAK